MKVTLMGGYVLYRRDIPITVKYQEKPKADSKLSVESNASEGKIHLSLDTAGITFDRAVISRCVEDDCNYLELKTFSHGETDIVYDDYYALPNTSYMYRVTLYNGDEIVSSFYNYATGAVSGITIADKWGGYSALGELTKYPVNRNDRGTIVEVMDSEFPYHILNGSANYETGQIKGIFTEIEDCKIKTDNIFFSKQLRAWLNNGCAKILKYYTGEAWLVTVTGVTTEDSDNTDVLSTNFNWTQIGNADDISAYTKLGLVTEDE